MRQPYDKKCTKIQRYGFNQIRISDKGLEILKDSKLGLFFVCCHSAGNVVILTSTNTKHAGFQLIKYNN